jgi:ribosome maturation factor RimP
MDEIRLAQLRELVEPILSDFEMELVELTVRPQGRQQLVRLLVDKVGGVTIAQCSKVNQLFGQALEDANMIEGSYTIEVSSPGLDRPMVSKRDFERALGEDIQVELALGENRFKELAGMLLAVQPEAIVLKMSEGNVSLSFSQIRGAKRLLRW